MAESCFTVLLIAPLREDRAFLRHCLEQSEPIYRILEAPTGQAGLKICQQTPPDAILWNCRALDHDSLLLLQQLPQHQMIPVLLLLEQANPEFALQAQDLGADCLVQADLGPSAVRCIVRSQINQARLQRQLAQQRWAEAALAQSESALKEAQRIAHIGSFEFDIPSQQITWSEELYRMFGLDPEQPPPTYAAYLEQVHPADRPTLLECVARAINYGIPYTIDYRALLPDGSVRYHEGRSEVAKNAAGQVVKLFGTCLDITDRKQVEEALRASETTKRAMLAAIPDLILRIKGDGTCLDFIPPSTGSAMTFVPIQANVTEVLSAEVWQHQQQRMRQASQTGELQVWEHQVLKNGILSDEEIRLVPCGPDEYLLIVRDITLQKQAELTLKQSEAIRSAIVQAIPDLLIRMDSQGNYQELIGGQYLRVLRSDKPVQTANMRDVLPPSLVEERLQQIQLVLDTGRLQVCDQQIEVDGQQCYEEVRIVPLMGQEVLMIVRDITERKQAELELQRLNEELERRVQQRTEELAQSERDLRTIFNNVYDAILIHAMDGTVLDANDRALELRGATREQLLAASIIDLSAPDAPLERLPAILERIQAGETQRFEWKERRFDDGSIFDVEVSLCQVTLGNHPVFIAGVRDITDRKRAELALRESEERFRVMFEQAAVGIVLVDLEGRFVRTNHKFYNIVGFSEAELIGRSFEEITHPDDIPPDKAQVQRLLAGEASNFVMEKRYIRKDKTIVWANLSVSLVRDMDGKPEYFIAVVGNIDDRKQAELALRESEERFRTLFEATPNPIQGYDKDRRIIFWNQASEKLYGYSRAEAIGQPIEALIIPQDQWSEILPLLDDWIAGKGPALASGELHLWNKDREPIEVYSTHVMLTSLNGAQEMYCIDMDLRDRKRAETALQQLNQELEQRVSERTQELQQAMETAEAANRAKTTFLANMSHELRTPLNAILGFAQLMSRDLTLAEDKRNQIQIINRSGEHLLNLINDILEMSKIEAGRISFSPSSFDLDLFLENLEEMFKLRAIDKGLQFVVDRPADLPRYITTDANKLRQVLINLIGNAIKFTSSGQVIVQIKNRTQLKSIYPLQSQLNEDKKTTSLHLHFEVKDSGIGIATEELDSLFEPFIQSNNRQISQEGTGLGLPISRQFVQLMGGDLTVQSRLGEGAVFSFTIPVELAQATAVSPPARFRPVLGLAPGQPTYRLLVAEDNATNRELLVQLLQSLGFEVQTASNGQEAIDRWRTWQPQLIWMDMRMPIMDGYEATRQIRAAATDPSTPVILALTANAFEEDRAKTLGVGCNGFIRKPYQEAALLEAMANHLNVQYLYADQAEITPKASTPSELASSIAALQALPAHLLAQLYQATIQLDTQHLLSLIATIAPEHPGLAALLRENLNDFAFEQILTLLQEVHPTPSDPDQS